MTANKGVSSNGHSLTVKRNQVCARNISSCQAGEMLCFSAQV